MTEIEVNDDVAQYVDEHDMALPDEICKYLRLDEVKHIHNRDGWAIGTVAHVKEGEEIETISGAVIDLFTHDDAQDLGGVRFMAYTDEYRESYAYGTADAFSHRANGWYVKKWEDPEDPDVGNPAP